MDDAGFEELMEEQRERARSGAGVEAADGHEAVLAFAREAAPTSFVGYETLMAQTSVVAARGEDGGGLVKLEESPFYAEGGGQVADSGTLRWDGGEAAVADVYRIGDDQALRVDAEPQPGTAVEAVVDHETRHATMRNHTATHLLHAALRERLGDHVRQAGSAVRPDKLRFDFTHGAALDAGELRDVEERVNGWIKASRPVRAMQMERAEAEALGAMALFGEKYGDWVRVIEVDGVSRELCGGTHVQNTGEVGHLQDRRRGLERGERPPDRGVDRPRRDRLVPRTQRGAGRGRRLAGISPRRRGRRPPRLFVVWTSWRGRWPMPAAATPARRPRRWWPPPMM